MFIRKNSERQSKANYTIKGYKRDNYNESRELNIKILYCDYDAAKEQYKLIMAGDEQVDGIYKITKIIAVYVWNSEDLQWYKEQGESTVKDKINNIRLTWKGKQYIAYLPEPSDISYWGNDDNVEKTWPSIDWYLESDESGNTKMKIDQLCKIKRGYDATQNSYTIELIEKHYWPDEGEFVIGKYQCSKNGTEWISVN